MACFVQKVGQMTVMVPCDLKIYAYMKKIFTTPATPSGTEGTTSMIHVFLLVWMRERKEVFGHSEDRMICPMHRNWPGMETFLEIRKSCYELNILGQLCCSAPFLKIRLLSGALCQAPKN